jgi:HK97 family phage major capsid protein
MSRHRARIRATRWLIRATIVDRAGVRVIRDPYSAKPYILFYTTKRVGGGVQDFDAIKLLKFAVS